MIGTLSVRSRQKNNRKYVNMFTLLQAPHRGAFGICGMGIWVEAEVKGFEPLYPVKDHAFQACAIDHYATPPAN